MSPLCMRFVRLFCYYSFGGRMSLVFHCLSCLRGLDFEFKVPVSVMSLRVSARSSRVSKLVSKAHKYARSSPCDAGARHFDLCVPWRKGLDCVC